MPLGVFVPARAEDLSLSFASGVDSAAQGSLLYRSAASRYVPLAPGTAGQVLTSGGPAANPAWQTAASGVTDHGLLTGLLDDDHTQYTLLAPAGSARNVIQPTGIGVVPLTVRGFAGQTAALQSWEDSTTAILGEVAGNGNVGIGAAASATAQLLVGSGAGMDQSVIIRAGGTQVGNLIETQNNAGATTGFFRVSFDGVASGPGALSLSERFGAGSLAAGASGTAVGNAASAATTEATAIGRSAVASGTSSCTAVGSQASATGASATAIGRLSVANNTNSTALGSGANATGISAVAVGGGAVASAQSSFALGQGAQASQTSGISIGTGANVSATNSIAIGSSAAAAFANCIAMGTSAAPTAANQMVLGSTTTNILAAYIGKGVVHATPVAVSINITGGSGSDIAGGTMILAGGRGTGSAVGGSIKLQSTLAAASSSTANALQDKWVMTNDGIWQGWQRSTTADRQAFDITPTFATATDASRKARAVFNIWDTAVREGMRLEASGTAPMIGFLGAAAVVRQTLSAAATDPATTQTLANSLRTALINLGLGV